MESLAQELAALIASFKEDVATAVQRAALEAIAQAYGEGTARNSSAQHVRSAKMTRLARRGASDIAAVKGRLLAAIGSKPGQLFEQLRARLRLERRELVLPLRRLVDEGKVKTTGVKRATAYYPATRMTTRLPRRKKRRTRRRE